MSTKNIGMLLLAVYLIVVGLIGILSLHFAGIYIVTSVLALAAGIMILLGK
jgi:hypothetical protein